MALMPIFGAPALHLPRALAQLSPRLMTLTDADEALAFRRQVLLAMPPALRVNDEAHTVAPAVERHWVQTHLGSRAWTLGVWDDQLLVALACLQLADADDPDDAVHLVGMPAAQRARTAHLALCLVHEDYRGMHLQAKLLNWRREIARARGRTLLVAMTACGNTYSRRNLLAAGLGIHWIGERRPGHWWYAMAQDLSPQAPLPADRDHEWVDLDNLARQVDLLDDGFVCVAETAWLGGEHDPLPRLQYVRRPFNPLRPGGTAARENEPNRECAT